MTDPAVEAARTAWRQVLPHVPEGNFGGIPPENLTLAAREALRPIREWHQKQSQRLADRYSSEALMLKAQLAEIAPLIYPTEELER